MGFCSVRMLSKQATVRISAARRAWGKRASWSKRAGQMEISASVLWASNALKEGGHVSDVSCQREARYVGLCGFLADIPIKATLDISAHTGALRFGV